MLILFHLNFLLLSTAMDGVKRIKKECRSVSPRERAPMAAACAGIHTIEIYYPQFYFDQVEMEEPPGVCAKKWQLGAPKGRFPLGFPVNQGGLIRVPS